MYYLFLLQMVSWDFWQDLFTKKSPQHQIGRKKEEEKKVMNLKLYFYKEHIKQKFKKNICRNKLIFTSLAL